MPKRISVDDLVPGMVIGKEDRSRLGHPFLVAPGRAVTDRDIGRLRAFGIEEVLVETEEGEDAPAPPGDLPADGTAAVAANLAAPLPEDAPYEEEIHRARVVAGEARMAVRGAFEDVRAGRRLRGDGILRVVGGMIDSVFRNPYALPGLARIKGHDDYTYVHSVNVCILCVAMGRHLGCSREELEAFGTGALLHDIGKARIPASVLERRGELTGEEMREMRRHPLYSAEILLDSPGIPEGAAEVALQHHERYNGSGYPLGLKGDAIGRFAQIAAIIDVYDAVTSDRGYKDAVLPAEGLKGIHAVAHADFNIAFVERFIQCLGIYPIGTAVLFDTGEAGIVCSINPERLLRPQVLVVRRSRDRACDPPFFADLEERSPDLQGYRRTIVRPIDPREWGIDPDPLLESMTP